MPKIFNCDRTYTDAKIANVVWENDSSRDIRWLNKLKNLCPLPLAHTQLRRKLIGLFSIEHSELENNIFSRVINTKIYEEKNEHCSCTSLYFISYNFKIAVSSGAEKSRPWWICFYLVCLNYWFSFFFF